MAQSGGEEQGTVSRMSFKDFAKGAMVIAVAQVLVGVGNFLLLPVITRTLGTHDYGVWITLYVTVTLLTNLVVLGLSTAMLRFLPSKTDRKEISEEFFTILAFVIALAAVMVLGMVALSGPIAAGLFNDSGLTPVVIAASFLIPLSAVNMITLAYFRAVGKVRTFVLLLILTAWSQLAFILALSGLGIFGVVSAALSSMGILCVIALLLIVREVGISLPRWDILRANLKFSLPLAPNSIISWVTDSSDRYIVAAFLGLGAAGIYAAAWGIGMLVFQLVTPIEMILYPTMSKLYDEGRMDEVKSYLSRSLRYFLILTIPAVIGLTVLAEPLLVALTTSDFASGAVVIPFIAISAMIGGIIELVTTVLLLVKKTHLNLIVYTVPAVLNVVFVLIATPFLGIAGAAMASTLSYIVLLALGVWISFRHIRFPTDWACTFKSVACSLLMAVVIILLSPVTLFAIVVSIGVGALVYFGAMTLSGGLTREELDFARSALDRVIHRT